MAVAVTTTGNIAFTNANSTGFSYNADGGTINVAAGSTALLFILVANMQSSGNLAIATPIVWNTSETMTKINDTNEANTGRGLMFGLINPTSGNHNITGQLTGTGLDYIMVPISFNGTATDTLANCFKNANTNGGTSAGPSVQITSETGSIVVAGHVNHNSPFEAFSAVDNTAVGAGIFNGGASINFGANRANGAAPNVTLGATLAASGSWSSFGIDVAAPAASGNNPIAPLFTYKRTMLLLGWRAILDNPKVTRRFWK